MVTGECVISFKVMKGIHVCERIINLELAEEFILAFSKHPFLRLALTLSNHKIDGPKIKEYGQVDPIRVGINQNKNKEGVIISEFIRVFGCGVQEEGGVR